MQPTRRLHLPSLHLVQPIKTQVSRLDPLVAVLPGPLQAEELLGSERKGQKKVTERMIDYMVLFVNLILALELPSELLALRS